MTEQDKLRAAMVNLVRHVAYADSWLRQTDAFDAACAALGLRFDPRGELFEVTRGFYAASMTKLPNPYEIEAGEA